MFETLLVDFALLVTLLIMFIIYVGPFILIFSSIIFVLTRKSIDVISKILIVIIILLITFLLFIFGADMQITLLNDGTVTIVMEK